MPLLYFIFFIFIATMFFLLGYRYGKREPSNMKKYSITFEKSSIGGKTMRNSYIVKEITIFCDRLGIKIDDFKIDELLDGELNVHCTKDQYYLLIQELSNFSKYMLSIKEIAK